MRYNREKALVNDFILSLSVPLNTPWGSLESATEFFYHRGRTDIVATTKEGDIFAFEAKLKKWRDALHQAYRNTCFADFSYIVVPEEVARNASRYVAEFSSRAVGICYLSQGQIIIALEAKRTDPLQVWLSKRAANLIAERNGNENTQ